MFTISKILRNKSESIFIVSVIKSYTLPFKKCHIFVLICYYSFFIAKQIDHFVKTGTFL